MEMIDDLLTAIEKAFPGEPLGEDVFEDSLGMWDGYLDATAFESGVAGRTWQELDPRFLEFHHDVMAYAGPATFAAALPAYLAAFVRMDEELDMLPQFLMGALIRDDGPQRQEIFDARTARLTEGQRTVIAHILSELSRSARHEYYLDEIEQARERYWCSYLQERGKGLRYLGER